MHRIMLLLLTLAVAAVTNATAQTIPGSQGGTDMRSSEFHLSRITMAVENFEPTVNFYRELFGATFEPLDVMGYRLYAGRLLGMDFLFTPNTIAGVEAKQSRHQFDVIVADMESALKRVVEAGGRVREEQRAHGARSATIVDPDGNTITFIGRQ